MSVVNLSRTKEKGSNRSKRAESTLPPPTPAPPPLPAGPTVDESPDGSIQFQLGNTTLEAVDRLTGMSADEIEVVADRLMDGARETEEVLRELALRVRQYGLLANEKLAKFVKAANICAETARGLHGVLADPESAASSQIDSHAGTENSPPDLNALESEIEAIGREVAPPTQPHE
jgi:hypothetical protein